MKLVCISKHYLRRKCLYICFFKLSLRRIVPKFGAEQDITKNFEESSYLIYGILDPLIQR
jgi:hypothetical protein